MRNIYIIFFIMCISSNALSTEKTIQSLGSCSPYVETNIGIIVVNCTNNIDKETKDKINRIVAELSELDEYKKSVTEIKSIINRADKIYSEDLFRKDLMIESNTNKINNLEMRAQKLHDDFIHQWELLNQNRDNLNDALANLQDKIDTEWEIKSQYWLDKELKKYDKKLLRDFNARFYKIEKRLSELEAEIIALKSDVSYLMKQYLSGNYPKKIGFFGVSLGTLNIDDDWHAKYSIEYELLLPKMPLLNTKGSFFIEVAGLDWEKTSNISTLPGIEQAVFIEKNNVSYYGLGAKFFITQFARQYHLYTGAVAGNSFSSDEDTAYFGIILGTEYHRQGSRILLEFRYDYYSEIEETFVKFDPFGDPLVQSVTESKDGLYIGIKLMFR